VEGVFVMFSLSFEILGNGFVRVLDRSSGLVGLYEMDGSYRSGDLRNAGPRVALHVAVARGVASGGGITEVR
jgi:hypothetical protein